MKLILVDDEKGILEGLKKMVDRYIPECEVVGTAYNGLEGFELIQRWQPDIVITDIRMPQAGGLDMIQMLKTVGIQSKFILLSGYADFEYAQKGIKLGVNFYINKPVEEQELRDCVCQVMEMIRLERSKVQEMDALKKATYLRIQEDGLRDILDMGNDHTEIAEELLRIGCMPGEGAHFACILIEINSNAEGLKELGFDSVFRQIDLVFRHYGSVYRFRYTGAQIAVIVIHGAALENRDMVHTTQRLHEVLFRQLNVSSVIGIGSVQEQPRGISQSFEEARNALSYQVIKGGEPVFSFTQIMNMTGKSELVTEEMIAGLEAAIDSMDERESVDMIHRIFRRIEAEPGFSPADLQLQCLNLLLLSIRKVSFQQLQQNTLLSRQLLSLEGISRFKTLASLEQWMVEVIGGIIAFMLEHRTSKKRDMISEIKEYVTAHYDEPISLAELAARFYMNPYYLSQFFKQKTGETYLNFLTHIRISKAKELLEQTDLKIYEICHKVGYSDAQHFARMFEKWTGFKPRDYRKSLAEQ
ncbi:helix-turn-helix domain-containing protein [Paenibacillus pabuli]|uniref:helix-turn-helix domain-containing protein n=1 Tax=Paenibacillus pabuli TaxID=1472 RepID=UPI0007847BAC|nr:helix-turn-helix domain-containing protein [Paenibacillus pabuli]MEC0128302.1 response regulator [Paenibacillus pabuli]